MNRMTLAVGALAVAGWVASGWAAEGKKGTLSGELVDTKCYLGMDAKGASHQKCAIKCAKAGIPVGVLDEKSGKVYTVAVPAGALADGMAKTARVTGEVFEDSHIVIPEKVEVQEGDKWVELKLPAMQ
jgi:hypothetical protein